MSVLYLDCSMGASGDMIMGALYELIDDKAEFIAKLNNLCLPGVHVEAEKAEKCGIKGTHIKVTVKNTEEKSYDGHHHHHHSDGKNSAHSEHEHHHHHHHHHHSDSESSVYSGHRHHHSDEDEVLRAGNLRKKQQTLPYIQDIIDYLPIDDNIKKDAKKIFALIAGAESKVHGEPVDQIHFHEVGTMDAVCDVVGIAVLMNEINPSKVIASPVNVGFGTVICEHGELPVPAPAAALLLQGIPTYAGETEGELCTPTGAAALKYYCDEFDENLPVKSERVGIGMGTKDFDKPNCLKAVLGLEEQRHDTVTELTTAIDDMTPEEIGFVFDVLLNEGALDVYTIPAGMKKCRPGVLLTCLCSEEDKDKMAELIFKHTTTLGIRANTVERYRMNRKIVRKNTNYGELGVKISEGWGVRREKIEYEERAKAARENDVSVLDVAMIKEND